jgi:hypothetical protein
MTRSLKVGPLELHCGDKHSLLSTLNDPKNELDRLIRSSPDHTLYHQRPYTEFLRWQGSHAETVALTKSGELVCAMTVIPETSACFDSGFFGLLFPPASTEKALKKAVGETFELFARNGHLRRVQAIQSISSRAAMDHPRRAALDYLLTTLAPPGSAGHLFSRVLELPPPAQTWDRKTASGSLTPSQLENDLLKGYDSDIRNQIRQAERNGLTLRWHIVADAGAVEQAYREYDPVHAESWRRTELSPHSTEYWHRTSRAVTGGGGVDVLALAVDGERVVAGATCHVYQEQALYFSGGSLPAGLEKRANPLALHAAISLCRRLGVRWFEIGRFEPHESEKLEKIRHYKSQFGGRVLRVTNLRLDRREWRPVLADEAYRFRYRMPLEYPRLWRVARHLQPLFRR